MNENNNRVTAALAENVLNDVMTTLQTLETLLNTYVTGLSPEERMALPKINVDNKTFVEDAINEMRNPAATLILPAYLKPANAETDLKMYGQMDQVYVRLANLTAKVDSTRMLAGSEAYTTALSFKKMADAAEAAGIPGADAIAQKLRERFKGQGASGPAETTPPAGS